LNRKRLASLLRHRASRDPLLRVVRDTAREAGVEVFLVGGYVRDAALGRKSVDLDLSAGRGSRELVRRLERSWRRRSFRFQKRRVTTWRFAVGDQRIDLVDASRRGLLPDLHRRDLTINAIAFDLVKGEVVDPLRGLRDLSSRLLRLSRPGVIRDDPVRALRIARFMAQIPGARIHPEARRRAPLANRALRRASVERIREELDKLLTTVAPQLGLDTLDRLGLLGAVLPELVPLGRCKAGSGRPDVWSHTVDAIAFSTRPGRLPGAEAVRDPEGRRVLRWALLLHDISKPETLVVQDDGKPSFHGHEVLGARRADAVLERLRLPRQERRRICRLILLHLRPGHLADTGATPRGLRRLARDAGADLPLLIQHAAHDARGSGSPDNRRRWPRMRRVLRDLMLTWESTRAAVLPPLVDGRDVMRVLGVESGPIVGKILDRIRDEQESGEITDRRRAIARVRRMGQDRRA